MAVLQTARVYCGTKEFCANSLRSLRATELPQGGGGGGEVSAWLSNKVMGTYWEDKVKQKHVQKLSSIKPSIDNKPPATYPHLQNKRKKMQLQEERLKAIERENGILLSKLSRIAARKGPEGSGMERAHRALHPGEACSLGSLNGLSRKRELQRIARDDQAILKRIQERQSQKSCYDRQMMDNEWQQTLMYRRLASQHQESPTKDSKKSVVLPPIDVTN